MSSNPFEVLRLDPSASDEEVVRQGGRLRQRATDETTLAAIRQAVQALTGEAEARCLQQYLTHPGPCYRWPALERFTAAFRRPPLSSAVDPELDLEELTATLQAGGHDVTGELLQQALVALRECRGVD